MQGDLFALTLQDAQPTIGAYAPIRGLLGVRPHLRADRSHSIGDQMSGPADSGLFIYAKDIVRVAAFYESILGMTRRHATPDLVVLQGSGLQLVVHALASEIATAVAVSDPPVPRDDAALKFFFTVPSLATAREVAPTLGGMVLSQEYPGRGFRASNAVDPEGNIFHLRESAA